MYLFKTNLHKFIRITTIATIMSQQSVKDQLAHMSNMVKGSKSSEESAYYAYKGILDKANQTFSDYIDFIGSLYHGKVCVQTYWNELERQEEKITIEQPLQYPFGTVSGWEQSSDVNDFQTPCNAQTKLDAKATAQKSLDDAIEEGVPFATVKSRIQTAYAFDKEFGKLVLEAFNRLAKPYYEKQKQFFSDEKQMSIIADNKHTTENPDAEKTEISMANQSPFLTCRRVRSDTTLRSDAQPFTQAYQQGNQWEEDTMDEYDHLNTTEHQPLRMASTDEFSDVGEDREGDQEDKPILEELKEDLQNVMDAIFALKTQMEETPMIMVKGYLQKGIEDLLVKKGDIEEKIAKRQAQNVPSYQCPLHEDYIMLREEFDDYKERMSQKLNEQEEIINHQSNAIARLVQQVESLLELENQRKKGTLPKIQGRRLNKRSKPKNQD